MSVTFKAVKSDFLLPAEPVGKLLRAENKPLVPFLALLFMRKWRPVPSFVPTFTTDDLECTSDLITTDLIVG